jgi:CBS domain-containing protein
MFFPISQLIESHDPLLTIRDDRPVSEALALMLQHDYSQLPVVDRSGYLSGIVSEQALIRTYYHWHGRTGLLDITVGNCQSDAETITADGDIFDALDLFERASAVVIVRGPEPVGILTAYDVMQFFRQLSEDLMRVEDIERTLRERIEAVFKDEAAQKAALVAAFGRDKQNQSQPARDYERLTLGEYVRLIVTKENWPSFEDAYGPKQVLLGWIEPVFEVRNQLAHFRGRLDAAQRDLLTRAHFWIKTRHRPSLGKLAQIPSPRRREVLPVRLPSVAELTSQGRAAYAVPSGDYDTLTDFLSSQPKTSGKRVRLTFDSIETAIKGELPLSAREYRSWWSNEVTTDAAPAPWVQAGWRVEDVDLSAGEVSFQYTPQVLTQMFFARLLADLKRARPGLTRASRTQPQSWFSLSAGRTGFSLNWAFTGHNELRVELYIDVGKKEVNKRAFDALIADKAAIEQEIGFPLQWQRLDDKKATRICVARSARITDPPEQLEETRRWALDAMLKFADVFPKRIKALSPEPSAA